MNLFFRMSNRLKYLLFLILLVSCFSCTNRTESLLDKAEKLMDRETEQGIAYLNEAKNVGLNGEYQMNLYKLLSVYANYKQWNPIDSVGCLLPLVRYFDENGTKRQKVLAHYLISASYQREKNYAMQYRELYLAKESGEKTRHVEHLQALTEHRLAILILNSGLYKLASQHFLKTFDFAQESSDSLLCGASLSYYGICLFIENKDINCLDYLRKGFNYVLQAEDKNKDRVSFPAVCNNLCEYFMYVQQMDSIEPYAKIAIENSMNVNDSMISIYHLAVSYCYTGRVDSSMVLFKKVTNSPSSSDRAKAYMCLADIAKAYKRIEQSLEYERLYNTEMNNMAWDNRKEIILKAKHEVEEEHLKKHKNEWRKKMAFIYAVSLLILLFAIWGFLTRRRKQMLSRKEDDSSLMQEEVYKKMVQIVHNYKNSHASPIHMEEQDWIDLMNFIERRYNNICQKLTESYGMTTDDIRFCCLILTGFTRFDMHYILERSETAAYQRERYILQHRFGITDKDKRLKDVLIEMAQEKK